MSGPRVLVLAAVATLCSGLTLPSVSQPSQPVPSRSTRRDAIVAGAAALAWAAAPHTAIAAEEVTTKSGLTYSVVKGGGKGEQPVVGDLIAIRFKCTVEKTGAVIDDILNSPEPYYYRVGSGQVVPAIEEAVVMMRTGDVYDLTVPPALGFGPKGRSSSPGKPRIAGDAILKFTLSLDSVPGKDEEIIEQNGIID